MKESKADLQEGNQNEEKNSIFCIPAQGHTNPMLPIAAELVRRGNAVRFYSFDEFEKKIRDTGAEFLSCDSFLPKLTEQEEAGLKNVSATEMTVQDIRITLSMNDFLDKEFKTFQPDVVYTDSVCFWGKLNAWKHHVPMAVSTSTFAFNQMSSQYMKNSPKEMADMIFGLPKVSRELKKLEPYGFQVKSVFSLIQSDNHTDSVVYTSRRFRLWRHLEDAYTLLYLYGAAEEMAVCCRRHYAHTGSGLWRGGNRYGIGKYLAFRAVRNYDNWRRCRFLYRFEDTLVLAPK
ncbi:hypothetical protein AALB52_10605 [Lachnospiraceae bacterium 38-14]